MVFPAGFGRWGSRLMGSAAVGGLQAELGPGMWDFPDQDGTCVPALVGGVLSAHILTGKSSQELYDTIFFDTTGLHVTFATNF